MNNVGGTAILVRFPQGTDPNRKNADMRSFFATFFWPYQHDVFHEAFWTSLKEVHFASIPSPQFQQYNLTRVWIFWQPVA